MTSGDPVFTVDFMLAQPGQTDGVHGSRALRTPRVAIIGAGVSGIGMAAKLTMAGVESFHLYEAWDDLGGTWHANTYPGLHCDVASRYYQYTFAPNPDWSQRNASGREIWAYLNEVADRFGVRERTSFRTRVTEAEWVDGVWRLRTDDGREEEYDFVVTAAGGLVHTKKPELEGLETFAGSVFHSAEWDHSVALEGKRIGVIGTGSTGMQITRALARSRRPLHAVPAHGAVDLPSSQPELHARDAMAVPPLPGAQPRRLPRLAAAVRSDLRTGRDHARAPAEGDRRRLPPASAQRA